MCDVNQFSKFSAELNLLNSMLGKRYNAGVANQKSQNGLAFNVAQSSLIVWLRTFFGGWFQFGLGL